MPSDRRWSDADRELVGAVLHEADYYDDEATAAVLDALTAAGWCDMSRVSGYLIDGEIHDPRDVTILTRTESA